MRFHHEGIPGLDPTSSSHLHALRTYKAHETQLDERERAYVKANWERWVAYAAKHVPGAPSVVIAKVPPGPGFHRAIRPFLGRDH